LTASVDLTVFERCDAVTGVLFDNASFFGQRTGSEAGRPRKAGNCLGGIIGFGIIRAGAGCCAGGVYGGDRGPGLGCPPGREASWLRNAAQPRKPDVRALSRRADTSAPAKSRN